MMKVANSNFSQFRMFMETSQTTSDSSISLLFAWFIIYDAVGISDDIATNGGMFGDL